MTGVDYIRSERERQMTQESFTQVHDTEHRDEQLAYAAACYALPEVDRGYQTANRSEPFFWPWDSGSWKPSPDDRIRELAKAGALIAAEIDRIQNA